MRDFTYPQCGRHLTFENSRCLSCGSALGFSLKEGSLLIIARDAASDHDGAVDAGRYHLCANLYVAECNWIVGSDDSGRGRHTDTEALPAFAAAERAKRRLVLELTDLKLPIVGRDQDPERGLAFDLLSSEHETVLTGHDDGLITLNLVEGDDVHLEQLRIAMNEPYRTLLGHFRHQIGHYYFHALTGSSQLDLLRFRELFGEPDTDYQEALDRHYDKGTPEAWRKNYVSSYAAMHPAEDWAETFARYLHIRDTLDTSAAFGFAPAGATFDRRALGPSACDTLIDMWLPLAWSLNMVNRSMGRDDLYPFVLAVPVLDKMRFVHTVIDEVAAALPATT
jgi:hypothetical protein